MVLSRSLGSRGELVGDQRHLADMMRRRVVAATLPLLSRA
jgi:hypothetical protein